MKYVQLIPATTCNPGFVRLFMGVAAEDKDFTYLPRSLVVDLVPGPSEILMPSVLATHNLTHTHELSNDVVNKQCSSRIMRTTDKHLLDSFNETPRGSLWPYHHFNVCAMYSFSRASS